MKNGSGFNFDRDFSIAMTFSVSDTQTEQGLLYKGTGSDVPPSQTQTSFRVKVSGGNIVFEVVGGDGVKSTFTGPSITAGNFYKLMITKHTETVLGDGDGTDPYAPPFDTADILAALNAGQNVAISTSDGAVNVAPNDSGQARRRSRSSRNW